MHESFAYLVEEQHCVPLPSRRAPQKRYSQPALGVVISGTFEYRAQDGAAVAVPGTVILGNRSENFSCHPRDDAGNRRLVVTFAQSFLDDIARDCGLRSARFQAFALPPGRFSGALFGRLRRLSMRREDHEEVAHDLARAALHVGGIEQPSLAVSARGKRQVLSIIRHLEQSYAQPWPLKSLAESARLSPCYFLRVFRRVTGQSPAQYVLNARLRAAANDLLTSCAPVHEIAFRTGFNDISHFNASFRQVFGRNPTQWRL